MQKIILISVIYFINSCTYLPQSIGKANQIIVITSIKDKSLVEPFLSDIFSSSIQTPQPEKEFILKYQQPRDFQNINKYGNIILVSLDFPADSTADILTHLILSKNNQDAELIGLGDLYANHQLFLIINAHDAVEFENILRNNSEWILDEFHTLFEKKVSNEVFKHGKNLELSNKIFQIIGHSIDLQPDFKLIKADSLNSFVWVGRGFPYRWLLLHRSIKDNYLDFHAAWDHLKKDYAKHMPEIKISSYYKTNENVLYGKNKIQIMRGLYEHPESYSGGPFFVYIFDTGQMNEVILISGFVSYPGHEKLLLLKQLEIMAKTFYKGDQI